MASLDSTKADELRRFLLEHRLTLADFKGDEQTKQYLGPQFRQDKRDLLEAGRQQRRLYGDNPTVKEQFERQMEDLRRKQRDLLQLESAKQTMSLAERHPESFASELEKSRTAERALDAEPYDSGGFLSGAFSGGLLGNRLGQSGARAKHVNPRFFGPIGAIAGSVVGAGVGKQIGKRLNEHVSGHRYDEVKAPYEVARGLRHVGDQ